MKIENHSYFLFGSSFFTKLKEPLGEQGVIAGTMLGISPISEFNSSAQSKGGALTCWLPELDAQLAQCDAEYFVLDLQTALQNLLCTGGGFVSASAENLKRLTRNEIAVIDPLLLPQERVDAALDRLIGVIGKHFTAKRIILIHTHNSPYWLAGNNLRAEASPAGDEQQTKWLDALEAKFCEKTDCHFVDVTRFYFYQKETGRPLTNVVYEKECYKDVAERIFNVTAGGTAKAERPNFAYSLDRYAAYYFTLQRKPQRVFLDVDYFLDRLILCSSAKFVKAYREELLDLDALDWHDPEKALYTLRRLSPDSTLTKICVAFYAVLNGLYFEEDVDYALMFRCEVVPDVLIAYLKKEYAPQNGLLPAQINRYNAGYHFAKFLELDPEHFSTGETVAEPTVIDIFGSCISRTLFNVQDNDFAVNNYWFHVPPFEHRNKPVSYKPSLFPAKPSWKDRLVKLQFEGGLYQNILDSSAEWLVIDLYFLISPNNFYYQGCLYGDFDHRISNALKAQKINLIRDPSLFGTADDLLSALDPWLEIIKKKYGNKIILVTGQRLDHWIGDDDRIYQLRSKSSACNPFLAKATDYVRTRLDCYTIDIGKYFLPDDIGYMRNTPAHKEDLGYFAAHDLARYIVDNEPEQKLYEQYNGDIHMAHLKRLSKVNSPALMEIALPLSELDKAVVRLGWQEMVNRHDELAEIYDASDWTMPLEEVISAYVSDFALADALRTAAVSTPSTANEDKYDYADYPADAQIIGGFTGDCKLSLPTAINPKKPVIDKERVLLSWSAPAEKCVRIYRRTDCAPWTLVGKSTADHFADSTAPADTDCTYTLCIESEMDGQYILTGFSAPSTVRTALAAPVLISAVHIEGINTLRWVPVPNAESYRIYHKDSPTHRWALCATVDATDDTCFSEQSKFPTGGEWYTVRAQRTVDGTEEAGGFQSGLSALPL